MAPKTHTVSIAGDNLYNWTGRREGGHVVFESHIRFNHAGVDSRYSGISRVSTLNHRLRFLDSPLQIAYPRHI